MSDETTTETPAEMMRGPPRPPPAAGDGDGPPAQGGAPLPVVVPSQLHGEAGDDTHAPTFFAGIGLHHLDYSDAVRACEAGGSAVAAPAKLTVVAMVLRRSKAVLPVVMDVVKAGPQAVVVPPSTTTTWPVT